jgi:hypothetical protein
MFPPALVYIDSTSGRVIRAVSSSILHSSQHSPHKLRILHPQDSNSIAPLDIHPDSLSQHRYSSSVAVAPVGIAFVVVVVEVHSSVVQEDSTLAGEDHNSVVVDSRLEEGNRPAEEVAVPEGSPEELVNRNRKRSTLL